MRKGSMLAAVLLSACARAGSGSARLLVAAPMPGAMAAEGKGLERAVRLAVEEGRKTRADHYRHVQRVPPVYPAWLRAPIIHLAYFRNVTLYTIII